MKRILCFVLIFLMCLTLCACGKSSPDFDSRTFDFFSDSFHWDMTVQEAEEYIKDNQIDEADIEISEYEDFSVISDGYYVFRFDTNDKMEFVKVRVDADEHILDTIIEEFGNYDKKYEFGDDPIYCWYGTMDGKNVQMALDYTPLVISETFLIEFELMD